MTDKSRNYTKSTVKRLHTLSGNQCAAPECTRALIARDEETIVSKICHIQAAGKNGPRYNPEMTEDDRRHFDNLILLCDECHSIIDNMENESQYPVSLLQSWKKNHENKLLTQLNSNPSLLKLAINAIANAQLDEDIDKTPESLNSFNIQNKITYNSIKRNRSLIEEYKIFYSKISILYNELENQGSFKKDKLLRIVKQLYIKAKGKYITNHENPINEIRANADNIIEDVEAMLLVLAEKNANQFKEDISFGVSIIMVDAFMRCKILEEPE